ncbi:branched-chain amino acid ABC transporter permease [Blastochloris viridis]|uniref:High-affinity branched-chain amino acid transport system permease protein LivH n=1 Tax=Blastochloris viridis TaxID=1079 RepID=A0A0H5BDL1_BLAVI|nr:branched-chain amino acid ABC transporter permease [Blastochloris viridis]ALK09803.1 High-affinity branched-chain amino acid transport system permease protein LivH [Blastochloris viridis]BAS00296.1 high-affinity branched-chain amino acid transport system permease protein LivH [Blastochloris viridis]CUU42466.1 LIV-I protein H [Blastochloris viridis]
MVLQQTINGLITGSTYALFALGFTLVFGVLRILNLAHGAVFMAGAFVGLYAVTWAGLPLPLAFGVAVLVGGLIGVVVDWVAFRPLRRQNAAEFIAIVSSLGVAQMLMSVAQGVSNTLILRYPFGTFPVVFFEVFGLRISLLQITIVALVALLVTSLLAFLYATPFGRQIRAVAVSARTASLLGVRPDVVYAQTFFLSGALAAATGVIIGIAFNSVHFLMGEPFLLKAFVVVVLGGLGSVSGAVVAALLLGLVQSLTVAYLSSALSDAIIYSLLFAALLVRPGGLFGTSSAEMRVVRQ